MRPEICYWLDGLPLAIVLAAARIQVISPEQMLSRLRRKLPFLGKGARDRPARQQTLESAIGWSYDLLEDRGANSGRGSFFETIREFAGKRLEETDEKEAEKNPHASYFLTLAEEVEPYSHKSEVATNVLHKLLHL